LDIGHIVAPAAASDRFGHAWLFEPHRAVHDVLAHTAGFSAVDVQRSVNHFPISFLAQHAGQTNGLRLSRLPLPDMAVGLRQGNMLTKAQP